MGLVTRVSALAKHKVAGSTPVTRSQVCRQLFQLPAKLLATTL